MISVEHGYTELSTISFREKEEGGLGRVDEQTSQWIPVVVPACFCGWTDTLTKKRVMISYFPHPF